MKNITINEIKKFHDSYDNSVNKIIENAIYNNGIDSVCLNKDIIAENQNTFNIELPNAKEYDQGKSSRCWCFSTINTIKYDIAKNMNIKDMDLELSISYLIFFDKLEKSNKIYENIIACDNYDYRFLREESIMDFSEGGLNIYARKLINKYGIIPYSYMPDSYDAKDSNKLNLILQEKIKQDIKKIIELKNSGISIEDIRKEKFKMLNKNYSILSKVLGEPPREFILEYRDEDNKFIRIENMTPLKFKDTYLQLNLDNFVSLYNIPKYNREYYKKYIRKYDGSIFENTKEEYINVPYEDLQEIVIKQLKNSIPVPFTCPTAKMWDRKDWILDTRIFDYKNVLDFELMNKEDGLDFYDTNPNHSMTFVGTHIIDDKPLRFKVENSWGNKEFKQYITMNNNFFGNYVLKVEVLKEYLTPKIIKAFEQKAIEIDVKEW